MKLKQFTVLDLIYLKNKFDDRKKLAHEWLDEITSDTRKDFIENEIEKINNDVLNCLQLIDKND